MDAFQGLRVALVHDWLTGMRGGERCLEVLCEVFPDADLYTLLHVPGSVSPAIEKRRIVTSFVQRLPAAATAYRYYLPLFPAAVECFDLRSYDLIVSMSHAVAKGVRPPAGALHVSYCFTPMRYVWDMYDDYFGGRSGRSVRLLMPAVAAALRRWDRRTSARVHRFIAISRFIADRIRRCYDRDSVVIYPPVDLERFTVDGGAPEDFYLVVSALVPYKRVDLAVEAATRLGRRLVIVGTGPEERRLRALGGPTVEFAGWRSDAEVADLLRRCRALLFPGVEDFGIVPLEAMAAGRPVIAYGVGGARETVVGLDEAAAAPTGLFFQSQTPDALADAILRFERSEARFSPAAARARASAFGRERYRREMVDFLEAAVREWRARRT